MAELLARRTASTAATYYKILRVLYGWLVDEEELEVDPMAKMKPPIVPANPVPVVPADGLKRLFAARAGTSFEARRDTALIMLLLDTGARRAEMVGLRLTDVDLDVLLVLGKGGNFRVEVHDILANDEHAVGLHTAHAEREGKTLQDNNTLVFHVRDGKVTEVWQYWADPYTADELFA
jgi:site-specific recombinase XerD